jgi:FkbM family methyltransferase
VNDPYRALKALKARGFAFKSIFDIGANTGRWTQAVQGIFPEARFDMFEPLAGRHPELDKAAVFHELTNHFLHKIVLSDLNGSVDFKVLDTRGVGSSILVLDSDRSTDLEIIRVESWRLDDYVQSHGLPKPDFIKLDTQASELRILMSAVNTLKEVKFILTETWARRIYGPETPLFHELSAFLYEQNFLLFDIISPDEGGHTAGREANGELRWFDAIFINRSFSITPKWFL